jgi:hypothetical protein
LLLYAQAAQKSLKGENENHDSRMQLYILDTKTIVEGWVDYMDMGMACQGRWRENRIQDSRCRMPDSVFKMQETGYKMPDTGYRIQDAG